MQFSTKTLLQAAACASSVTALSLPGLRAALPRTAPATSKSVSFTGTITDGTLIEGDAPATTDSQALQKRGVPATSKAVSFTGTLVDGTLVEGEASATVDSLKPRDDAGDLIEGRQVVVELAVTLAVLAFVGEAVASALISDATADAYEYVKSIVTEMSQWNVAREDFTQQTTASMWTNNTDYAGYPAAICYNKGYSMKDADGFLAKGSVTLTVGVLHTDYDCLYMAANNTFYTQSDGGYINLSYSYDSVLCTYDQTSGDLAC